MKLFEKICKMNQSELKNWLKNRYKGKGFKIVDGDGFLYLEPLKDITPICLTAHMDTVHKEKVKQIIVEKHVDKTILSSPQGIGGDDRCGIYMICRIIDDGLRPYVVFCEDEEVGCVGAGKFAKTQYSKEMNIKFMVELDRRNATDAVYYELDSDDFEEFITKITGYKTASGSFSDICKIAPAAEVAAVNLSCGYYKEHTLEHYVIWEEMMKTLSVTRKLAKESKKDEVPIFEYKALPHSYYGGYGYCGYGGYNNYSRYQLCTFTWIENSKLEVDYVDGFSFEEAVGIFMMEHPNLKFSEVQVEVEEEWL